MPSSLIESLTRTVEQARADAIRAQRVDAVRRSTTIPDRIVEQLPPQTRPIVAPQTSRQQAVNNIAATAAQIPRTTQGGLGRSVSARQNIEAEREAIARAAAADRIAVANRPAPAVDPLESLRPPGYDTLGRVGSVLSDRLSGLIGGEAGTEGAAIRQATRERARAIGNSETAFVPFYGETRDLIDRFTDADYSDDFRGRFQQRQDLEIAQSYAFGYQLALDQGSDRQTANNIGAAFATQAYEQRELRGRGLREPGDRFVQPAETNIPGPLFGSDVADFAVGLLGLPGQARNIGLAAFAGDAGASGVGRTGNILRASRQPSLSDVYIDGLSEVDDNRGARGALTAIDLLTDPTNLLGAGSIRGARAASRTRAAERARGPRQGSGQIGPIPADWPVAPPPRTLPPDSAIPANPVGTFARDAAAAAGRLDDALDAGRQSGRTTLPPLPPVGQTSGVAAAAAVSARAAGLSDEAAEIGRRAVSEAVSSIPTPPTFRGSQAGRPRGASESASIGRSTDLPNPPRFGTVQADTPSEALAVRTAAIARADDVVRSSADDIGLSANQVDEVADGAAEAVDDLASQGIVVSDDTIRQAASDTAEQVSRRGSTVGVSRADAEPGRIRRIMRSRLTRTIGAASLLGAGFTALSARSSGQAQGILDDQASQDETTLGFIEELAGPTTSTTSTTTPELTTQEQIDALDALERETAIARAEADRQAIIGQVAAEYEALTGDIAGTEQFLNEVLGGGVPTIGPVGGQALSPGQALADISAGNAGLTAGLDPLYNAAAGRIASEMEAARTEFLAEAGSDIDAANRRVEDVMLDAQREALVDTLREERDAEDGDDDLTRPEINALAQDYGVQAAQLGTPRGEAMGLLIATYLTQGYAAAETVANDPSNPIMLQLDQTAIDPLLRDVRDVLELDDIGLPLEDSRGR